MRGAFPGLGPGAAACSRKDAGSLFSSAGSSPSLSPRVVTPEGIFSSFVPGPRACFLPLSRRWRLLKSCSVEEPPLRSLLRRDRTPRKRKGVLPALGLRCHGLTKGFLGGLLTSEPRAQV